MQTNFSNLEQLTLSSLSINSEVRRETKEFYILHINEIKTI